MLAFTHLRADLVKQRHDQELDMGMGFEELRRVYNVLVEKELRIHVDIEGMLDEIAVSEQERGVVLGVPFNMPVDDESGNDEMHL